MTWADRCILDLFGIDVPIIQAPMAGSSSLEMALAVSREGGLGSLACAASDSEGLVRTFGEASAAGPAPLNVNFFAHSKPMPDMAHDRQWLAKLNQYYADLGLEPPESLSSGAIRPFDQDRLEPVMDFRPEVVSFHFGLPAAWIVRRLKDVGISVISSATTVAEAVWLQDAGCDAIIAQGLEAGGHRGMFLTEDVQTQIGTFALVPQIVDAVDVPVIAAGGIADGRGIAAALALGASGVQIGTAYLRCPEAGISEIYRERLRAAGGSDTVLTNVLSGRPTRVRKNRLVQEMGPISSAAPAFPLGFSAAAPLRQATEIEGISDFSAHYCGQAAPMCRDYSAAALTRKLSLEAIECMDSLVNRRVGIGASRTQGARRSRDLESRVPMGENV